MKNISRYCSLSVAALLLPACASSSFNVPDEKFFVSDYDLGKGFVQIVELADDNTTSEPAAERFHKNCNLAETNARARFKIANPQTKDEGRRLGEYFEKSGACRVRMAFKK